MNTINEIRTAIEARLATEMANAPAYTVAFQNVPFTPPNNTSWVQSSITFGTHESATLQAPTSGYNKHNGELIVMYSHLKGLDQVLIIRLQNV